MCVVCCVLWMCVLCRVQHKRVADEAVARANALHDTQALAEVDRARKEEAERQTFRANVTKHAQQMVRCARLRCGPCAMRGARCGERCPCAGSCYRCSWPRQ